MDFIETCRKFISIDSSPSAGNKAVAELAADFCRHKGLFVETQEETLGDNEQMNVIARPQAERPGLELMLQTHLDTVDPGPYALWAETGHNPFDAHIYQNKIYGLGTADVKLDFLCKLEAIAKFPTNTKWKLPPVLVGTFGEETGMVGALKLIRKNKISAKMALIGEPSNLQLINAGKGFAAVEIRIPYSEDERNYRFQHNLRESTSTASKIFNGKAAHSSVPHLGESAIKKMFDHLAQINSDVVIMEVDGGVNYNTVPSHAFLEVDQSGSGLKDLMAKRINTIYSAIRNLEQQMVTLQDPDFFPSHPTLNIGLIRTHEDHVFISGNCRMPPNITTEIYEEWMNSLKKVCDSVKAEFRVTDYKKPFRTEANSVFVRGCLEELKHMGLSDKLKTQASTNEASLFSRVGIECVSFGAGLREGNSHTPRENVSVDDLYKAIDFYAKVIERFCL